MTRFDAARQRARAMLLERAGADTQVHLVVARATPGLIASGSPGAIRDALDRLVDSDEPGDAAAAMALAAEVAPDGEIIWIGDERGERTDNVGLTILSAQPSAREPGMVDVLIGAVNAGTEAVDAPLIVTLAGTTQGARVLRLPAAAERPGDLGRATLLLRVPSQPGALLEARLQSRDALPLDDSAALRFAPPTPIRVAFMAPDAATAERSPLRALLSVMDSVRVEQRPCGAPREALAGFDLIVADGCMPSVIASGGIETPWLVFARDDASTRWRASVPGAARAHPVMVGVPPLMVDVAQDAVASVAPGAAAVASLPPGAVPLLVDGDDISAFIDPRGPGVRFRFPLAATDWPADPSWVMTMQNAVQWLVGDSGESAGQAIRTGIPARVLSERRDGTRAWITVPPQRRLDPVIVRTPDGAETSHPVSLLDESQSDLRFLPAPADPRGFERTAARRAVGANRSDDRARPGMDDDHDSQTGSHAARGSRALWPWFALAALLLLAVEWCVYLRVMNRRAG